MLFADSGNPALGVLLMVAAAAFLVFYLYMMVKHPELYRDLQRQNHERQMLKAEQERELRQQRNASLTAGIRTLAWWLSRK